MKTNQYTLIEKSANCTNCMAVHALLYMANRFLSQIEIVAKLNSNLDISASSKSYIQNHANTWHVKVILQTFVKGLIFILVQNLYQITSWILCTILVVKFDERHQCLRVGTKMCLVLTVCLHTLPAL